MLNEVDDPPVLKLKLLIVGGLPSEDLPEVAAPGPNLWLAAVAPVDKGGPSGELPLSPKLRDEIPKCAAAAPEGVIGAAKEDFFGGKPFDNEEWAEGKGLELAGGNFGNSFLSLPGALESLAPEDVTSNEALLAVRLPTSSVVCLWERATSLGNSASVSKLGGGYNGLLTIVGGSYCREVVVGCLKKGCCVVGTLKSLDVVGDGAKCKCGVVNDTGALVTGLGKNDLDVIGL